VAQRALVGDGAGAGAVVGGLDGTGFGDFPVGTGVGVTAPSLLGTGLATGAGDLYLAGSGVGTADGAALRGTGAAVAGAEADGLGAGALVGSADGAVGGAVDAAVAVAEAAAAPCVSWVACALAECAAPDGAAALPDAEVPPEQPVSASPAATPTAAPNIARGVFECDRICLLLDMIPTMTSAPGNTA